MSLGLIIEWFNIVPLANEVITPAAVSGAVVTRSAAR